MSNKVNNYNKKLMKRTTDGIIDVLIRMFKASKYEDFFEFVIYIKSISSEEFYNLPISD